MKYNILVALIVLGFLGGATALVMAPDIVPTPAQDEFASGTVEQVVTADDAIVAAEDLISGEELVRSVATEAASVLTAEERDGLIFMREEEKLARDVYLALFDVHGIQIFQNIAMSEQTHMDAVRELLDRYEISDPVTNDARGVFTSPTFSSLYTELVARGQNSVLDALTVGAYIEDLDTVDLQKQATLTNREDILAVYAHLERGSRNHLRAFNRQIVNQSGATYEPVFLTDEALRAILEGESERGAPQGGGGQGGGQRGGR